MRQLILSFSLLFLMAGCSDITIKLGNVQVSTSNKEVDGVYNALKNASKDDCLKVYTLFKSFSNYTVYTQNTKNTAELMSKFQVARKDIGWEDSKYKLLTEFTSTNIFEHSFITKVDGGIKPEELTQSTRDSWSQLFSNYAEGAKKAYLEKK